LTQDEFNAKSLQLQRYTLWTEGIAGTVVALLLGAITLIQTQAAERRDSFSNEIMQQLVQQSADIQQQSMAFQKAAHTLASFDDSDPAMNDPLVFQARLILLNGDNDTLLAFSRANALTIGGAKYGKEDVLAMLIATTKCLNEAEGLATAYQSDVFETNLFDSLVKAPLITLHEDTGNYIDLIQTEHPEAYCKFENLVMKWKEQACGDPYAGGSVNSDSKAMP
jgi:hypothetical protein